MAFERMFGSRTPRGGKYREGFKGRAGEKRVIARDLDGKPQAERDIEIIRELDEDFRQLADYNGYIGVSYRGSNAHGYAKSGTLGFGKSDLDIGVIIDPSLIKTREDHLQNRINSYQADSYANRGFGRKQVEFLRRSFSLVEYDAQGHEIPLPRRLMTIAEEKGDPTSLSTALAFFCEDMIGPRVQEYRAKIAEAISSLPEEVRFRIVDRITNVQVLFERERTSTLKERFPGSLETEDALQYYFEERRKLWKRRVSKVLLLPR